MWPPGRPSSVGILALVCTVLGFILLWVALATPAWQVVYAIELRQWIQSGLWMSCQTRPTGMYQCTYTFSQSDYDFFTNAEVINLRTPAFYPWQRTLLHLFLVVQACALAAMISSCASVASSSEPSVVKCTNLVYAAFIAVAAILSVVLLLAFAIYSHKLEFRFYIVSVSGIYEKHHGYSFYVALLAGLLYVVAFVLSVAHVALQARRQRPETRGMDRWVDAADFPPSPSPQLNYAAPIQLKSEPRSAAVRLTGHTSSWEDEFAMRALPDVPSATQHRRHY